MTVTTLTALFFILLVKLEAGVRACVWCVSELSVNLCRLW